MRLTRTGRVGELVRVRLDQRLQPGLRHRIGAPVGVLAARRPRRRKHGAAGVGALEQRIERADQAPVGRKIDVDDGRPGVLRHVVQGREGPEDAGAGDENVELAPALVERRPQLVDLLALAQVELEQRGLAAVGADLVVELLERADRARGDDDVGALLRQSRAPRRGRSRGRPRSQGPGGPLSSFLVFMPGPGTRRQQATAPTASRQPREEASPGAGSGFRDRREGRPQWGRAGAAAQPTSARSESWRGMDWPFWSASCVGYSPVKQWSVNCGLRASRWSKPTAR